MKTPIQELIDSVGNMAQGLDAEELYDYFTKKATELLEKERKVKKTVEERAEEEYPLIAAEGFGGANAIIMRQREAYIKGATDNQEQRVDYQKMFSNCSQPDQLREQRVDESDEEEKHNMAACMLSILDSLKLYDTNSLELDDETLSEMMFRKMKGYNIDLNKELGFTHLEPVTKPKPR